MLPLSLKWPNDLMLGDAKLAGILLERSGDRVVAGFRRQSGRRAGNRGPQDRRAEAARGHRTRRPLLRCSPAASRGCSAPGARRNRPQFAQAWLARAHPIGTPLEVHSGPGERIAGTFDGIEPDGAMRLKRGRDDRDHPRRRRHAGVTIRHLIGARHRPCCSRSMPGTPMSSSPWSTGGEIKARWRIATDPAPHRRRICRLAAPVARA